MAKIIRSKMNLKDIVKTAEQEHTHIQVVLYPSLKRNSRACKVFDNELMAQDLQIDLVWVNYSGWMVEVSAFRGPNTAGLEEEELLLAPFHLKDADAVEYWVNRITKGTLPTLKMEVGFFRR